MFSYTVSGPSGGHQLTPVTWTITPNNSAFAGTITATPSGGQLFGTYPVVFTGNTTPALGDPGFEQVVLGPGNYKYNPASSPWTFSGQSPSGSGLTSNSSGFTSSNSAAPQGNQVAFLQETGTISQSVPGWNTGTYTLSFLAAQRNYLSSKQNFNVLIDGVIVGTFAPTSITYQSYSTNPFPVTAGTHTITFKGLDTAGGDNTVFIDQVSIVQNFGFSFTPPDADTITFTFSNSGGLTDPPPQTYVSTGIWMQDTFPGAAGTPIESTVSNTLPSGITGSGWTVPTGGAGAIQLNGNGSLFPAVANAGTTLSKAPMPAWSKTTGGAFEAQFTIDRISTTGSVPTVIFMNDGTNTVGIAYNTAGGNWWFKLNGVNGFSSNSVGFTTANTIWNIKVDCTCNGAYAYFNAYYSTDGGKTWTNMISSWPVLISSLPSAVNVGVNFMGTVCTATTGGHIGNLLVQDVPPPAPNCQISDAHITTCGQLMAVRFATTTGAVVLPTKMNYAPTLYRNGINVGTLHTSWITGYHQMIMFFLPEGIQAVPTDVFTLNAAASWMTCGTGNATAEAINFPVSNFTGRSCFGTDKLTRTISMGYNLADLGSTDQTVYNCFKNMRYRLAPMQWSGNTADGYPANNWWQNPGTTSFSNLPGGNAIDSTGVPGFRAGLYAVRWDDLAYITSPTQLAIVPQNSTCTCTLAPQYCNPGINGIDQVLVFDVQPAAGSTTTMMPLALQWTNTARKPTITNLWIVGPDDFVPGTPTEIDISEPYALSARFLDRCQGGIGSIRFMDSIINFGADTNAAECWHLRNIDNFSWNNSNLESRNITWVTAQPLVPGPNKYIYSEWAPEQFTATLATAINNQQTTITISDAATAPVFAGLLLQWGTAPNIEKSRVISVTGTTVVVERGSSGTTPIAQAAGPITVYGRFNLTALSQVVGPNCGIIEFVSQVPHGLKTGQNASCGGSGWPTFAFNGGGTGNWQNYKRACWVTGPNTVTWWLFGGQPASGETLSQSYALPNTCITSFNEPEPGLPYEAAAYICSQFDNCDLYLCLPPSASDSYVYAVAKKVQQHYHNTGNIYLEMGDENWNYGEMTGLVVSTVGQISGYGGDVYSWLIARTGAWTTIFEQVLGPAFANRVKATLNVQFVGSSAGPLAIAQKLGVKIGAIAVAPYFSADSCNQLSTNAYNLANIPQAVDMFIHDIYYDTRGGNYWSSMAGHNAAIAAYNAATGNNCELVAYECGYQNGAPDGGGSLTANNYIAMCHDIPKDPNFFIIQQDIFGMYQQGGFQMVNEYAMAIYYFYDAAWMHYPCPDHDHGRGDGSDGKFNNRLCLATPGYPNSKLPTVNQDLNTVSPRGEAFIRWNRELGTVPTESPIGSW